MTRRLSLLFGLVSLAFGPIAAVAAETALSIPFSVHAVEPTAGATTAALTPAKITFYLASGDASVWAPFNASGSYEVPAFDSNLSSASFHGLKYPRDKYSLFYEHANIYSLDGRGFLHFYVRPDCRTGSVPCLVPGSYLVSARRGPEYNADTFIVKVAWEQGLGRYRAYISRPGGARVDALDFRLGHVVDTAGYLACDFHEHPGDGDSWDPKLRLVTNLAEGIEVFGMSAHNAYRYYHKLIADFGVQSKILCVPSVEYTTARGHTVVLPQYGYRLDPRVGPCDPWADPAVDCPPATWESSSYPFDLPFKDTLYFSLRAVAAQQAAAGHPNLFFAAHPDNGYFSKCLDDNANLSDPANRRSCRTSFGAVERRRADSGKWMSLYNQGYRFSRLHNSDSHIFLDRIYPGNFVPSSFASIPAAGQRQALVDGLVQALAAGRSSMSEGPFLQLLEGATEVSGLTLSGPSHQLRLRIQAPVGTNPKTGLVQVINGEAIPRTVSYSTVSTPAGDRLTAELPLDLDLTRDSWLMVQSGETSFATNAVWIDHDRNGTIDPLIPLPRIEITSVSPAVAAPGDQVAIEFTVHPAPHEVQAWVAPNDPQQNPTCAADPNCDREALCLPPANGFSTSFRCTYRVGSSYPQVERPGPNEVRVAARGSNGFWALAFDEVAISYPDTDGDGMDDAYERLHTRPVANPSCALQPTISDGGADPDGDGLTSVQEKQAGTHPCLADTDGDNIKDGIEVGSGCSNPLMVDTDRDGACDGSIAVAGPSPVVTACFRGEDTNDDGVRGPNETSACNPDSDGDGAPDIWEKRYAACVLAFTADGAADPDHDGLTNVQEYGFGSSPCAADTDADGLNDGQEKAAGTGPTFADTDNDGIKDGAEAAAGGNPLNWDTDGDGLGDGEEKTLGSALQNEDTDGDGLIDGDEAHEYFSSPLLADTDGDGLGDYAEVTVHHTLAWRADSDLDGIGDGEEVAGGADGFITDANLWDTDADGMPDGFEVAAAAALPPLDPLLPDDSILDFDADGIQNLDEFWNGTDAWTWDPAGGAGCGFWAESDGDGFVSPADISGLIAFLKSVGTDYSRVQPGNGETQELDMDGFRSPSDLGLLRQMLRLDPIAALGSRPIGVERVSPVSGVTVEMEVGGTSHAAVGICNDAGRHTPGLGVVFEIGAGSTAAAEILGGDGSSGVGRYDLSGPIAAGGQAWVRLRALTAGTIIVNTRLPGCGEAEGYGRYSAPISGPSFAYQAVPADQSR